MKIRILFVCHGNICRSPMAEFVLKKMLQDQGLSDRVLVESAATSAEEIGNPVYPPVRRILEVNGIDCSGKTARQVNSADFASFDHIICMDDENLRMLDRFSGSLKARDKISLLLEHAGRRDSVADPWYTGDFVKTWQDVNEGCEGLLRKLQIALGQGE